MGRKIIVTSPAGQLPVLEEVKAHDEAQLQELLKGNPELLPLEDLGLNAPALVVGRESVLDSDRIDLVLLANGGDLVLVEFKTGPQNPDFRECLAQLLDYGSDLWGMSLEDFDTRVARSYFAGPHFPRATPSPPASLEAAAAEAWGEGQDDAVDWRQRLQSQLRDGGFHYIAVAQRFTRPVLRTVEYLNATMKAARFSAVELVRFSGEGYGAFEARFVAGAGPSQTSAGSKASLAGIEEFVALVADDDYRHVLQDLFESFAKVDNLTVFWGTSGCSLRVTMPGRSPLSVGWLFPPGPQRWMGLTDVTLGWYEDANGLALPDGGREALNGFLARLDALTGGTEPRSTAIRGRTFPPAAVMAHSDQLVALVREVAQALVGAATNTDTVPATRPTGTAARVGDSGSQAASAT